MKIKSAIAALALAFSASAMAEADEYDNLTQCEVVGEGAKHGMLMRQAGMPFAEVYLSNTAFQIINTMAYNHPIVEPQAAEFVATAFGIQMQLRCELDGIRWTHGGSIAFGSRR